MEYLPTGTDVVFQDQRSYVDGALLNPFIQMQVAIGIYDESNIYDDFLGAAKTIVSLNRVVVCLGLLNNHVEGLDADLAEAYVRAIAAHEAHHFEHGHGPASSVLDQAHQERDCNDLIVVRHPELATAWAQVEQQSTTYQRVYQRIRHIQEARVA